MNVSDLFESKYLKKEDISSPVVAIIANVGTDMLKDQSGQNKKKGILFFNGKLKPLILNVGNAKVLTSLYGQHTEGWIGKPIEIWVNPNVEMGGEIIGGLRLRPPQNATKNHEPVSSMNLNMALAALKAIGMTPEQFKEFMKRKGLTGYVPNRDTPTVLALIKEAEENRQQEQPFDEFGSQDEEVPL